MAALALVVAVLALIFLLSQPVSAAPTVSQDGWGWQNPLPQGNDLRGIYYGSSSDVFAVGEDGTILHYDGSTWSSMISGTSSDLLNVWGSSSSHVFAVGEDGTILHYDGSTWSEMGSGTTNSLYGVWGSSSSDVFAVGVSGSILHYDGSSWSLMTSGTSNHLHGVWGSSSSDVFTVGGSGKIFHYDGSTWSSMISGTSSTLNSVWGSSSFDVFVVGEWGTILHYDGSTWSSMSSGTSSHLDGVWGSSSSDVFAVGEGGTILHYDGSTWSDMSSDTSSDLEDVYGGSSSDVFAVGYAGTILHYGGSTWSDMSSVTKRSLYSVWGSSSSDVFAVGDFGTILHYDGSTWSSMSSGTYADLQCVWGSSSSDVYAVEDHRIHHYDGSTWNATWFTSGFTGWESIWGSSSSDVFVVGEYGKILHYDGSTWSSMSSGTTEWLMSVWGSSSSDVFAVGDWGTILHYDGSTWSKMSSPATYHLWSIWGSSSSDVFTVGGSGKIFHYDGSSWSSMSSGTSWWLNSVWGSSSSDVFAVGDWGTILHYDGSTWSKMTSGSTDLLESIWGSSSSDIFTVGWDGTILHYPELTIASINPYKGNQGESMDVTITGHQFAGATNVSFGSGITVNSFTVDSQTQIIASITIDAAATTGTRDVSVTTPEGTSTLAGGFSVPLTIASIAPNQGNQGETLNVTVTGTNFTGATAISFGSGITVNSLNVDSSTQITANITIDATATTGARNVSVTTPEGTSTLVDGFSIPLTITSIAPNNGKQGETLNVNITGSNFTGVTATSFGTGITVNSFIVDSSTQITANITIDAAATTGARNVSVTSPGGTVALADSFTVKQAPPTITSVNPNSGKQGETLNITITGTNFTGATAVSFDAGITVNSFTVDSSTQITASITIDAAATTGARDVSVTNPGGMGTLPGSFMVTDIGYAIIVAGYSGDFGQWTISADANRVYKALKGLGFDDEHIFYLNADRPQDADLDGNNTDVDRPSSEGNLEYAITSWARERVGTYSPLILYLSGHGYKEDFEVNRQANEVVSSKELDSWLDMLPNGTEMLIFMDACYSGSFITETSSGDTISGENRIIITSTDDSQEGFYTYFFTSPFISEFWQQIEKGSNVREAFTSGTQKANNNIVTWLDYHFYNGWLDDNGDRQGHTLDNLDEEGNLSRDWIVGIPVDQDDCPTWEEWTLQSVGTTSINICMLGSPGELRVYDLQERVTGLVNGVVREDIPDSGYYDNTIVILGGAGPYSWEVVGTSEGSYRLVLVEVTEQRTTTFSADDISITASAINRYTVDWESLSRGEDGVTVEIDSDGDGTFEKIVKCGSELTQEALDSLMGGNGIRGWIWIIAVAAIALLMGIALGVRLVRKKK